MKKLFVSEYDPKWPVMYAEEAERIKNVLGGNCVATYHIGSTAVPGMVARPTVKIMAVVKDILACGLKNEELAAAGFEYLGEYGISGRRYYRKNVAGKDLFHLHIYEESNHDAIELQLAVTEYLRARPDICGEYSALKRRTAAKCGGDAAIYTDTKDSFVRKLEIDALAFYREKKKAGEDA